MKEMIDTPPTRDTFRRTEEAMERVRTAMANAGKVLRSPPDAGKTTFLPGDLEASFADDFAPVRQPPREARNALVDAELYARAAERAAAGDPRAVEALMGMFRRDERRMDDKRRQETAADRAKAKRRAANKSARKARRS